MVSSFSLHNRMPIVGLSPDPNLRCMMRLALFQQFQMMRFRHLMKSCTYLSQQLILGFVIFWRWFITILPPNRYGLFVLDKDLNVCDTIVFQNEGYRLALMKFSVNDSTIALTGPIFPNNSIYSKQSFVHFINVNDACRTNSVGEVSNQKDVVLYPNPADDYLNISITESINSEGIQIIDIMGRIVKETKFNKTRIDIRSLKPGIYFIKIANKNHINRSYKFIKI